MNQEQLLKHFDRIAEAPDAVPRLRRFILDLAVRGKLVEQDVNDEPTSELLKRIAAEKARLLKCGSRTKDRLMKAIRFDEQPFIAPMPWQFVRLGDVLDMINGRAFKPTEWLASGLPIVRIQNLNSDEAPFNFCDPDAVQERHLIRDDEFLISWSGTPGTSFGAFIWRRGLAVLNQHIFRCIQIGGAFRAEFLRLAINSQLDVLIAQAQGGVGLQHVTKGTLESLPLPLPPLIEQHRIVAKVDELMALCDRLAAAQNKREQRRDRLVSASLHQLQNEEGLTPRRQDAKEEKEVDEKTLGVLASWREPVFLQDMPRLTTRPEHIMALRQTILNLAVRGKLVEQNPADLPAPLSAKALELAPDSLPSSWRYSRLEHLLAEGTRNGYSRKPDDASDGVPILRISAGTVRQDGIVAEEEHKLISGIDSATRVQYGLISGDLLACRFNGNKSFVGRLKLFSNYLGINPIYPDKLIRVRVDPALALPGYVRLAGDSDLVRHALEDSCATTVGNWGISASNLKEVPFPLPPLAEQHRIVAKVDELMAVCDQLEANLTTTQTDSRRLLEAVLRDALAPALEAAACRIQ